MLPIPIISFFNLVIIRHIILYILISSYAKIKSRVNIDIFHIEDTYKHQKKIFLYNE